MAKQKPLTERQRNIVRYMESYMDTHGFPPTIREIGEATDIGSTSVVNYNLNKLVELGYIARQSAKSRGLRLLRRLSDVSGPTIPVDLRIKTEVISLPLYGRIVAGLPLETEAYPDEYESVEVTPSILSGVDPSRVFALRVEGDSMIDAMIQQGDIILLERRETATRGDMVAVWLSDTNETTLKYFYPLGDGSIRLQPAHPTMEPIIVQARDCQVQGRVLTVIRRLKH